MLPLFLFALRDILLGCSVLRAATLFYVWETLSRVSVFVSSCLYFAHSGIQWPVEESHGPKGPVEHVVIAVVTQNELRKHVFPATVNTFRLRQLCPHVAHRCRGLPAGAAGCAPRGQQLLGRSPGPFRSTSAPRSPWTCPLAQS